MHDDTQHMVLSGGWLPKQDLHTETYSGQHLPLGDDTFLKNEWLSDALLLLLLLLFLLLML